MLVTNKWDEGGFTDVWGCAGTNCRTWSGGQLDATSTKQNFIWASGPGDSIKSDSQDQDIAQHFDKGNFQLNLVTATGGTDNVNPFTATSGSGSGSGSGSSNGTTNDSTSGNTGSSSVGAPVTKADKVLIAHGMLVAIFSSYILCLV